MIFFKKPPPLDPPLKGDWKHHIFLIEKDEKTEEISFLELEKRCNITYNPELDFLQRADLLFVMRKLAQYREKGFLDPQQVWLGAYFQKEMKSLTLPPVRIKWIDDKIGWGVFANQDIKPMTYVGEYAGVVRRSIRADAKNGYCFEYQLMSGEKTKLTIDAMNQGGITRFINHCQQPNLKSAFATLNNLSHVVFFASRVILKGEQLCFDYGESYWKKRNKPTELIDN